jgi:hypothetical protein
LPFLVAAKQASLKQNKKKVASENLPDDDISPLSRSNAAFLDFSRLLVGAVDDDDRLSVDDFPLFDFVFFGCSSFSNLFFFFFFDLAFFSVYLKF